MRLAHIRIGIIANAASFTIKLNLQRKSFTHDMIFVAIHTKRCDARSRNDAPPRFDFAPHSFAPNQTSQDVFLLPLLLVN